ncbi:MAG: hypothetical protein JXA89_12950 [Anaerolineae bacterium]|nr:hypothetical protein [Anaerolineae bacterium]
MRLSQRTLNILVPLLLSLIGAFVVIEVGFRTFYQLIPLQVCASEPILAQYYCQPYFEYDKPVRLGYRYKPGFKTEGWWDPANPTQANPENAAAPSDRSDKFWYVFEIDEMGFPNSEYHWRDRYDIVITGDSFVTRTAPQTWIELLQGQTGQSILTLGASSWSTLNEAEAIKMYALDKSPKWVLVMFFEGNDLLNVGQYVERRDSGLSWREYDMRDVPLYRRLITFHMLKYWLGKPKQTAPIRYRYPVSASTEAGEIDLVLKDIHLLPLSADYETLARSDEFSYIEQALLELQALCKAQDTRLLLVYVPSKEHVYWSRIWDPVDVNNILERTVTVTLSEGDHGKLVWNPAYLSFDQFNQNHNAQERLFEDMTQENGIEFLNLTPIFWSSSIKLGETYHYADPHWNQLGNQIAADAIAEYIMTR